MRLVVIYLLVVVSRGLCDRDRPYTDFKLVSITAETTDALNRVLEKLSDIDDLGRDDVTNSLQIIVSPEDVDTIFRVVTEEQAEFKVLHNNLQESIDEEFRHFDLRRKKRQAATLEESVTEFLLLDEIYAFQDRIASSCDHLARVEKRTIGYSANNKSINVMKISKHGSAADKKTIFIEAGIHAREWLSPATANYIIYQLACKEENSDMLDLFNWEIVSTLNPDGYEYTHKGYRLWRKNMQRNGLSNCIGTDLNRNFEAGFGRPGASSNVCSNTYRGANAYSAPEAKALKEYVLPMKNDIISYLAVHTYGQYILLPWGYKAARCEDYYSLMSLARRAEDAMGIPFRIGSAYGQLYPAAGISADFARETAGIARSYTWELMPNSRYGGGFAPKEATVPVYTPIIWRGIRAYAQAVADEIEVSMEETTTTPTTMTTAAVTTTTTAAVTTTTTAAVTTTTKAAATTANEVTRPAHINPYLWNILQTKKDEWWYPALMQRLLASKPGDVSLG